jgi:hypothetical protein
MSIGAVESAGTADVVAVTSTVVKDTHRDHGSGVNLHLAAIFKSRNSGTPSAATLIRDRLRLRQVLVLAHAMAAYARGDPRRKRCPFPSVGAGRTVS